MATDKQLVRKRFEESFQSYDSQAYVQQTICERLLCRVREFCCGPVGRVLEIGAGTGFLTGRLAGLYGDARWWVNDLVPASQKFVEKYMAGVRAEYLWGDAEELEFPAGLDLIASASTVQWFEDKAAFAEKTAAALRSGGYLALALFGVDNFKEIKAAADEGLEYQTLERLEEILEAAGYEILHGEEYAEVLTFDSPMEVLKYIRALGLNSVRKVAWGHREMREFESKYRELFSDADGRVTLTYHPVLIIARKV